MAFILLPSVRRVLLRIVVFEFIHAFLARPFLSPFKMVAQEVEPSSLAGIHQPCFGRVQVQSVFFYPVADLLLTPFALVPGCTQHDEVVGVSDHFKAFSGHLPVQSIQVDI